MGLGRSDLNLATDFSCVQRGLDSPALEIDVPHKPKKAFEYNDVGYSDDGIDHVKLRFGFSDTPNIPRALRRACSLGALGLRARDTSRNAVDWT